MLELNKTYNMDCLDGMKLVDDKSIDMIFTSPPFKDEDVEGDYWEFYEKFMAEALRVTSKVICIIHSATKISEVIKHYPPHRVLIWYKGVMAPAYRYNPIFVYQQDPKYKINKYIWSDVVGCFSIKNAEKIHQYQDPIYLYETIIGMFKGCQTVLDPFMGSGTTAVACKGLKLDYLGFEIDGCSLDTANKRISGELCKTCEQMGLRLN